jgi:GNAT superfamily N-acetyltransferase
VRYRSDLARSRFWFVFIQQSRWYLSIIGLAPEFQNRGLGGGLVKPVLEKADALGVPSYLETFNPRNRSFYTRLGYQEAASFVEPVTGSEYWIMIREPLAGAAR